LDFEQCDKVFEQRCEGITAVKSVGASILLGQIFDAFGFMQSTMRYFESWFYHGYVTG
jgi:hypothetical protein